MADDLSFHSTELAALAAEPEDRLERRRKAKRKWLMLGLGAVVLSAGAAGAAHWVLVGSHLVTTDNAYVGASTAQINSQVSGQLLQVEVEDTQAVHKGDVLAVIDPADAQLAVSRAEADYERTLQKVRQYFSQEASAAAQVRARRVDLERTGQDYARRKDLASTGAISTEELATVRAAYDAAEANLAAAEQNLETQRVLTRGAGVDAHPETKAAQAALETARLALSRTTIRAPIDGVVVEKNIQVGQRVDPGQPLMVVAPLAKAYVDANFKEGQLERVRVGQAVELTSDLYGHDVVYHGRVTGLGGGTGSAFAVIPAQNATGNWIKVVQRVPVRVSLDSTELAKRPLRVGLSMEARIDVRTAPATAGS
jgi:membrane fusion protein (multidrug efflux system)